ncbi:MAG: enolase C-terminal domain-like protein [Gemmatimonadota bacterium]
MSRGPTRARVVRFRLPSGDGRSAWGNADASTKTSTLRTGFLLELRDRDGRSGWGEASPLAAYSGERPVEAASGLLRLLGNGTAVEQLLELLESPESMAWIGSPGDSPAAPLFDGLDDLLGHSASARSALISALADLAGHRAGVPTHELHLPASELTAPVAAATLADSDVGPSKSACRINALVPLTGRREALASATDAYTRGIRVLKAKLGSGDQFDAELELLQLLRGEMGDDLIFRLDANGSWTLDEARVNLDRLAFLRPEYVEEAVAGAAMAELEESPVPLAADESLRDVEATKRLLDTPAISVLILKPSLLGGLDRCFDLGLRAIRSGRRCVVTHGFEGPVGHGAACELALGLATFDSGGTEGRPLAQGLDRRGVLDAWSDVAVPQLRGPFLVPADVSGHGIDPSALLERAGGDGVI